MMQHISAKSAKTGLDPDSDPDPHSEPGSDTEKDMNVISVDKAS